jgi:hypothetical protein
VEDLLKTAEKWQLPGVVGIGGLLFLFLSFFAGFPSPGNVWSPTLRGNPHYGLLLLGIFLLAGAAMLAILPVRRARSAEQRAGQAPEAEAASDDPRQHPIVLKYWELPSTQKEIVVFFYEYSHHKRLPMNTFYKAILGRHGAEFFSSEDECFYRLKSLQFEGFLELSSVGHRETDVVKLDRVRKALGAADIVSKSA